MSEHNSYNLSELFANGTVYELANQYIQSCIATGEAGSDKKKEAKGRFPNLAGFCRYLGTGIDELARIGSDYPQDYDALKAVFEDEAYNSNVPPSLLSVYFKQRFTADGEQTLQHSNCPMGDIQLIFDHNISEDGA